LSEQLADELLRARLIANLATVNRDGTVHLVPLWFLWREPDLLFPTNRATRKVRNIERNPNVTIMIDDSRGGFDLRGITLIGEAMIDDGPQARKTNREIHLKYLTETGRDLPAVDRYLSTDDCTIRFHAVRTSTWNLRDTPQGAAVRDLGAGRPLD
jgi:PPOX class probable F420-dependent enzyme